MIGNDFSPLIRMLSQLWNEKYIYYFDWHMDDFRNFMQSNSINLNFNQLKNKNIQCPFSMDWRKLSVSNFLEEVYSIMHECWEDVKVSVLFTFVYFNQNDF